MLLYYYSQFKYIFLLLLYYAQVNNNYLCTFSKFIGNVISDAITQQQQQYTIAMAQEYDKYGDSKKDNRDNKTGPQGNAGPFGITELLFGVNVYEIVEERQIPASGHLDLFAVCDLGDTVITGGWDQNARLILKYYKIDHLPMKLLAPGKYS